MYDVLPTNVLCARRSDHEDTILHCLHDFVHSKEVWLRLALFSLPLLFHDNPAKWVMNSVNGERDNVSCNPLLALEMKEQYDIPRS